VRDRRHLPPATPHAVFASMGPCVWLLTGSSLSAAVHSRGRLPFLRGRVFSLRVVRPGSVPLCWMLLQPAIFARSQHPPLPPAVATPRCRLPLPPSGSTCTWCASVLHAGAVHLLHLLLDLRVAVLLAEKRLGVYVPIEPSGHFVLLGMSMSFISSALVFCCPLCFLRWGIIF